MTSHYTQDLLAAKSEGLARLLKIIRESPSETQVRLAAAVILRIRVEEPKQPKESSPASSEKSPSIATLFRPLTAEEIDELSFHFPSVTTDRFRNHNALGYWRGVLTTQRTFCQRGFKPSPEGPRCLHEQAGGLPAPPNAKAAA